MYATGLMIFGMFFLTVLPNCLGNPPSYLITSPDVLRVGSEEAVLINVFNTDETISVQLYLESYPNRENRFAEVTVDVTADSPKIVEFTINPDNIIPTESELQYVYFVAKSDSPALSFVKEERVLITYRQGYVFIQTDKPLYTPEQDVRIRIIPLTMEMLPSTDQFRLEIINGKGNIVERMEALTADENNGFYSYAYQFPKFPVFGIWTVTVSYGYLYQLESTVTFEVKEYVLPTYAVKFTEKPNYVLPSTNNFVVNVVAKHIYGKPVQGVYNLIIGYVGPDDDPVKMKTFSGELPSHGEIFQRVMFDELIGGNFQPLLGKNLYLKAVVKSSDGKTEQIIDTSAPFSLTAYKLQTTDTLQYFKAGLPYDGKFKLLYVNNRPALHTDVVISATVDGTTLMFSQHEDELEDSTDQYGEVDVRIDIPDNANILKITIRPKGQGVASENGEFEVTINKHVTSSGDSMLIRPVSNHFVPDHPVDFDVLFTAGAVVNRIYFMVVSKGKVLLQGTTAVGGVRVTLSVPITYEMTPSARIITYFVDKNNKIVADSLYLDVDDECENLVRLTTKNNQKEFQPNEEVEFTLHGKVETSVGLLAVDEAVLQLRNTGKLSLKKMFDTMEKFDLGCGPGGGVDAQTVFEDTGLSTISDVIETGLKIDFGCQSSQRRKRSVPYIYEDETDPKLIEVCELGYRLVDGWTCEKRTERIAMREGLSVNDPIVQRFYNCCRLFVGRSRGRIGSDSVDAGLIFTDRSVNERTDFRESFLFENVFLDVPSKRHDFSLPGSITKWQIQAVYVSPNQGMCVADHLTLTASLEFFIQLDIPYSVVRGEQVEIRATVFNYQSEELRVFMYLVGTEGICSEALAGQRSKNKKDFIVSAEDSYTVTYPMIPLRVGEFEIKVLAFTYSKNDVVTKKLRVVSEGVTRYFTISQILDPTGKLNGQPEASDLQEANVFRPEQIRDTDKKRQTDIIDLRLPPDAIEGTAHCKVRFTGNMMGPTISAIISDVEKMIKKPTGCGEQTLIRVGPNVFVTKYLTQINQLDSDFEKKAFRYLRQGYAMELTFFKPDGSFSVWGPSQGTEYSSGDTSSTWLTAFATKILCHAKDLIYVDPNVICGAIDWLSNPATGVQREDGAFTEVFRVHHREMTGGVQGDVSFTSYVLITLLECTCEAHAQQATTAIEKAVTFLETEFEKGVVTRPFAVAITAYALTLANSRVRNTINQKLREIATYRAGSPQQMGDIFQSSIPTRHWGVDDSAFGDTKKKPFWYVRRPSAIAVETTSYALLTQILNDDVEYSNPIVNWLTEQRNYDGGFVSTQDTIIALQALEAYSKSTDVDALQLDCLIKKDSYEEHVYIDESNAVHHQEKTPPVNGRLVIETKGTGIGQAQVEVRYNSDAKTPMELCAFDVEASATQWKSTQWAPVNGRIAIPTEEPVKVGIDAECGVDKVGGKCPDEVEEDANMNSPDNSRSRVGRSTSSYILDIRACARYHGHDKTGMSIIEVGLYSGFKAMEADLDLIKVEVSLVKKYELHDRAVVFYLDSIPRDEQVCVNFRASREMVVSAIQPVAVHVYDYYEPEEKCTDFYHPEPGSDLLNILCSDAEMCICAAGNCASCNSKMTKFQLKNEACSQNKDYAFEVNVISARVTAAFDVYNCSVEVIKSGVDDIEGTADGNGLTYREFWKSRKCRCPEIQANKKYLIMGVDGLKTTDKDGLTIYKYIIDEQSYVEYWPGVGRNGKQARKRLKKLNGLKDEMRLIGCGT